MRDHGGNLDWAIARYGGITADWLDLSTGINPNPYPVPELSPHAWTALPTQSQMGDLVSAARHAFQTSRELLPVAGAQAAIQLVPGLSKPGQARILGPTYNEHAASFAAAGWQVETVSTLKDLAGAKAAVVVNPNNPDGRCISPRDLMALAEKVEILVVDESFVDPTPEVSVVDVEIDNLIVLRSFGKFYGLAGLRLGFVLGASRIIETLRDRAGPWPVSGAAIEIGKTALRDDTWKTATVGKLLADADRLDRLASSAGWSRVGGTTLFRYYETPSATEARSALAEGKVWSRIFPYSNTRIRLGLPAMDRWHQLELVFQDMV